MNRKTKILIIGLFISFFLFANQASAAGLIPCGQREDDASTTVDESAPCTLCHFFILIDRIVDFFLFKLAPPLALLMLIIGGGMFMLATGNPQTITQAKKIITSVLIGIAIIYGAYFLVGLFLQSIGLAQWTTDIFHTWWENGIFTIDCDVPLTPTPPAPGPPATPIAPFAPPIAGGVLPKILNIAKDFSSNTNVVTFP